MKILSLYIFSIILLSCAHRPAQAQDPINYVTETEFNAITFNDKTLAQINATEGDPQAVQQLLGNATNIKTFSDMWSRSFEYGDNRLGFNYKKNYLNGYVTGLRVEDSSWAVVIKGYTIKAGDTEASLIQKFGQSLKIMTSSLRPVKFVAFNHPGNDYDGISIYINPNTSKVSKIIYFVNP